MEIALLIVGCCIAVYIFGRLSCGLLKLMSNSHKMKMK